MKGKRILQSLPVLCMMLFFAPAVVHAGEDVAQIKETGNKYETLQNAIDAAENGHTIELLSDVTVSDNLTIGKTITITGKKPDTGVYSITMETGKDITIGYETGNVTVQDILIKGHIDMAIVQVVGTFTMQPGTIINNDDTGTAVNISRCGTFTMNGGTIENAKCGVFNRKDFTMNGGTIRDNEHGVTNEERGTFTMNGGTIKGSEVGVSNDGMFKMTAGKMVDNSAWDVYNFGTFIKTREDTQVDPDKICNEEGAVYKEVDPVRNQWKPTTPEEKRSFACRGGEPVNYTAAKENTYEVIVENALQGPKCFVSFDAVNGDYTIARTYDIYPAAGKKYSEEKPARICLEIPAAFRKDGRSFRMICVSKDGRPFVLTDLDTNPATITFETSHFYAFALSYK